jgi:hypothetical protein
VVKRHDITKLETRVIPALPFGYFSRSTPCMFNLLNHTSAPYSQSDFLVFMALRLALSPSFPILSPTLPTLSPTLPTVPNSRPPVISVSLYIVRRTSLMRHEADCDCLPGFRHLTPISYTSTYRHLYHRRTSA